MTELPALDRSLGPTPGATKFYRDLVPVNKTQGVKTYNFGQGAEIDQPGGKIAAILAEPVATFTSPTYPTNGGPEELRVSTAEWAGRFLGIKADKNNTYVFGTQGRASLNTLFTLVAYQSRQQGCASPGMLIGNTHWPMLDQHMKFVGLAQKQYKMAGNNFPAVITDELDKEGSADITAVYVNSPDNPTGIRRNADQIREMMAKIEAVNKKRKEKSQPLVTVIFDTPYFMACDQRSAGAPSLLDAGFDGVLDGANKLTPWFVDISFSKAYGFATPGLHTVIAHPAYAKAFGDMVNTVYGNALEIGFANKVSRILKPEHDAEALKHFGSLKDKYTENKQILEKAFPGMLVKGEANMTCLMDLPKDMFGRSAQGQRVGKEYKINDMNDFLEYCGHEKGVVFVNNGGTLARIAMAMKPADFAEGVALYRKAFDEVYQAPKLAAA